MFSQRIRSATSIQYILISRPNQTAYLNEPPEQLQNDVIPFIKHCPEDLFQFASALSYFEHAIRDNFTLGHDFIVVNEENLATFLPHIRNSRRIKLFFVDTSIADVISTHRLLYERNELRHWFHFHEGKRNVSLGLPGEVPSPALFRKHLFENQSNILEMLGASTMSITPAIDTNYKVLNEAINFSPAHTNTLTIDSIIGNFLYEDPPILNASDHEFSDEEIQDYVAATNKTKAESNTWNRQNLLVAQVHKIDDFLRIAYTDKLLKEAATCEPRLSSIIIITPFDNPDSFPEEYRNLRSIIQLEQTRNYIYNAVPHPEVHQENPMDFIGWVLARRKGLTDYLDNVGFLHAGFQKSPVVRLPVKGSSIYRELSFFGLPNFPSITRANSRKKLRKTFIKIGRKIKEQLISPELEELISDREGQIVAISDLPIEWIDIKEVPFLFTHDICRLPQTSLPGLMGFYSKNNFIQFTVDNKILSKTLVIFGSDEEHFKKWQVYVEAMSRTLGFSTARCTTLEMVSGAIADFSPELLIFDCHGGFDSDTRATFLWIGSEKLTGEYVVERKIAAPLVIISACGTAPTYGSFNIIANAFFQIGAISVTSTYLPISVDSGSLLYIRVLNKLLHAVEHVVHRNWLEFICHLIRTSTITEAYMAGLFGNKNNEQSREEMAILLTESLDFYRRRTLYHQLESRLKNILKSDRETFSAIVPEYLFYSNLGRGDLVEFQNWRDRFTKLNGNSTS